MINDMYYDIIRLAASKKNMSRKSLYLLKGIMFYPFLKKAARMSAASESVTGSNQAGDDIYPLF